MSYVLQHSEAKLADRLVLLVLADHASSDGSDSFPAVATIAAQARVTRVTAQRCLRNLELSGAIARNGTGEKGQTNWTVIMDDRGASNCSPHQIDAQTIVSSSSSSSIENKNARVVAELKREIEEVWTFYGECFPKKRERFNNDHRKIIENALKVRDKETVLRAIFGLATSKFHLEKGFTEIRYALKGIGAQSDEARIDRSSAAAGDFDPLLIGIPSAALPTINSRRAGVAQMLLHPDSEDRRRKAEGSVEQLRDEWGLTAELVDGKVAWSRDRKAGRLGK